MDPHDLGPVSGARLSPRPSLPGVYYDASCAENAVNFFAWYCRFSQGSKAGQPFVLEPWQAWIIRQLFGWRQADGRRLYNRVFLWVPRGNGKTEMLAGVALLSLVSLLGPHESGGQTYSIAATEDQAALVFTAAQNMVAFSEPLRPMFESLKKSLYCPTTDSVFRPLTAKPTGKHGLRCLALLGDEMHEWKNGDLYDFVRRSQIKWADPLEFNISTAGVNEGYGFALWEECEMICNGTISDPNTLVVTYAADPAKDDLLDPAVWARVNPNLGVSIDPQKFCQLVTTGLAKPSEAPNVKRYHFNIWTGEDVERAIQPHHWSANTAHPDDPTRWRELADACAGRPCWGGLDLSSSKDLNARVLVFPPGGDSDRWVLLPKFWMPRAAADHLRVTSRVPIETWEAIGAITVTPGNASDHRAIERQIHEDAERYRLEAMMIDEWNSHQIRLDLAEAGLPVQTLRFGMKTIGPIWKRFEKMYLDEDFEHGSHPVLAWNAAGVALRQPDDNDNTMPTKRRSSSKIDGIAATLMGLAPAIANVQQSYYITEGVMIL